MKKLFILSAPLLLLAISCQKSTLATVAPVDNTPKGYIQVTCDNCRVDYGMPDQYRGFNLKGTSSKSPFSYIPGYSLQTYVTPLDHNQNLILSVHNSADKVVFADTVLQTVNTIWQTNIVLQDN